MGPQLCHKEDLAALGLDVVSVDTVSGLDTAPLDAGVGRLRAQVDAGKYPGFLSCVLEAGRCVHFHAYGLADICSDVPMQANTIFRLYSQTKPLTVVGFMQLWERGLVALEDPLSKYIPGFANTVVGDKSKALSRPITLHDLLAHTSGVGFGPGMGYEVENDYEKNYVELVRGVDLGEIKSLAEWCNSLANVSLRFQPGKDWGYGFGCDILGRVVEVVTGKALDVFLKHEVIDPLGMHDTGFACPAEKAPRLAALYKREPWDGNGKSVKYITLDAGGNGVIANEAKKITGATAGGEGGTYTAPPSSVFIGDKAATVFQGGGCVCSVAGGLVSSLRDYARFGQMLLNGGELDGHRFLKLSTVELLWRDWLNDFSPEKRKQPMWVWNKPGIGFSPFGQLGVKHPDVVGPRKPGAYLETIHWGGAGGSGYMFNWTHKVQVLTYTGCAYDTDCQQLMWKHTWAALARRRKTSVQGPSPGLCYSKGEDREEQDKEQEVQRKPSQQACKKRPLGADSNGMLTGGAVSSPCRRRVIQKTKGS